jgi:hypothetical protein
MLTRDELMSQSLQDWVNQMDQWCRVCVKDVFGNMVYIKMDYYGDGFEYDCLDDGSIKKSPGHDVITTNTSGT